MILLIIYFTGMLISCIIQIECIYRYTAVEFLCSQDRIKQIIRFILILVCWPYYLYWFIRCFIDGKD